MDELAARLLTDDQSTATSDCGIGDSDHVRGERDHSGTISLGGEDVGEVVACDSGRISQRRIDAEALVQSCAINLHTNESKILLDRHTQSGL
ncbi:MAG: hypothetical protein J6S02_05505 [Bacteroidaceae bacterium]|nr:hypothetical protein [Bacteroidaceae bacterium]